MQDQLLTLGGTPFKAAHHCKFWLPCSIRDRQAKWLNEKIHTLTPFTILEDSKKGVPMLDSSKHQVLIVDDDASTRDCLALFLQVSGYEVTTAANGEEALAQLNSGVPAVLLSDLYMPEMSGFELLPIVRRQFPTLPIVAMSAEHETRNAIPGGVTADAYYAKGHGNLRFLLSVLSVMTGASAAQAVNDFARCKSFID